MTTYPNQKKIHVHKEHVESDFLQLKNQHWKDFIKNTKDTNALVLYLYFAANSNNFVFALSPQAIMNQTGMARSTFYKKYQLLKDYGYLVEGEDNKIHFYETPQIKKSACLSQRQDNLSEKQPVSFIDKPSPSETTCLSEKQNCLNSDIEIDNTYNAIYDILYNDRYKHIDTPIVKQEEFIF